MFEHVKVFVGSHEILIKSNMYNEDPMIKINEEEEIRLNKSTHYQYPSNEKLYDYR